MDRLDPTAEAFIAKLETGAQSGHCPLADWVEAGQPVDAVVTLRGDEELEDFFDALLALPRIVVEFPAFTDGRGFSVARQLRQRGFAGELLAAGDVLPDQWQFLERCGFTGLVDAAVAGRADALPGISVVYQATR